MSYPFHRLTTHTRTLPAHLIRRGILLMVVVLVFGAAGEPGQALPVDTLPLLGVGRRHSGNALRGIRAGNP